MSTRAMQHADKRRAFGAFPFKPFAVHANYFSTQDKAGFLARVAQECKGLPSPPNERSELYETHFDSWWRFGSWWSARHGSGKVARKFSTRLPSVAAGVDEDVGGGGLYGGGGALYGAG